MARTFFFVTTTIGYMIGLGGSQAALAQENKLNISVDAHATYDSNILRLNDLRGERSQPTFVFEPQVNIDLSRNFSRQRLFVTGVLGYAFHNRYKFLDREDINLSGGANIKFGARCRVDPTASLYISQSDLADSAGQVSNTVRIRDYEVTVACPRTVGLYPSLSGTLEQTDNSFLRRNRDQKVYGGEASLNYALLTFGRIAVLYSHSVIDRRNRVDTSGNPIDDTSNVDTVGLQFDRSVVSRLRVSAKGSYQSLTSKSARVSSFSGFSYELKASYSPFPRLSATVDATHGVSAAANVGSSYYVNTSVTFDTRYQVTAKVMLDGNITYQTRRFVNEDQQFALFGPRGADRALSLGGSASFDVNRRIGLTASARYKKRNADNTIYNYVDVQGMLGLNFKLLQRGQL